jgi:hypothetical protein
MLEPAPQVWTFENVCLDKRANVFLVLSDEHVLDVLVPAFRTHLLGLGQRGVGRGGRGGERRLLCKGASLLHLHGLRISALVHLFRV